MTTGGSILFTGGSGYLGNALTGRLRAAGRRVTTLGIDDAADLRGDLLTPAGAREALDRTKPDLVLHAAALIQGRDVSDARLYDANMAMVANLLDAGARRLVFISSMTVYGPPLRLPATEDQAAPQAAYGRSKLDGERQLADRADLAVSVRLPGLFGAPRMTGLLHALFAHVAQDAPLRLPDAPLLWAAMLVDDAAAAIADVILAEPSTSTVVNIGYRDVFSIDRLVREVAVMYGRDIPYEIEHPAFQMDLTRLEALTGRPAGAFSDALTRYAELFPPRTA